LRAGLASAVVLVTIAAGTWALAHRAATPATPSAQVPLVAATPPPAQVLATSAPGAAAVAPAPEPVPPAPARAGPAPQISRRARPERERAPGFLNVSADPWAEVVIDGRKVGTTPLRSVRLSPGSHQVRLTHPARRPVQKAIVISSGHTELLDVELQSLESSR
jgi:hypothetical protein